MTQKICEISVNGITIPVFASSSLREVANNTLAAAVRATHDQPLTTYHNSNDLSLLGAQSARIGIFLE